MSMTDLCAELRNWFTVDKHFGKFNISGGVVSPLSDIKEGQYYRIVGSVLNDGVYKMGTDAPETDGEFEGAVWTMAVPKSVEELSKRIDAYNSKQTDSPYTSESFGGYSYSKATKNGMPVTWRDVFGSELNKWRKL